MISEVADEGSVVDNRWTACEQQWKSFPSGHDDLLDGCYWAQYSAFKHATGASASKQADGSMSGATAQERRDQRTEARNSRTLPEDSSRYPEEGPKNPYANQRGNQRTVGAPLRKPRRSRRMLTH